MLDRSFEDDQEAEDSNSSDQEAEYVFEGFNIEFSEKIMLIPLGAGRNEQSKDRTQA